MTVKCSGKVHRLPAFFVLSIGLGIVEVMAILVFGFTVIISIAFLFNSYSGGRYDEVLVYFICLVAMAITLGIRPGSRWKWLKILLVNFCMVIALYWSHFTRYPRITNDILEIYLVYAGAFWIGLFCFHARRKFNSEKYWITQHLSNQLCPVCNYDLRNLPSRCCPECGTTWEESDLVQADELSENDSKLSDSS